MTDEATAGLSEDSALAVWSVVITVVTSGNKTAVQYIRGPKRCPIEHSVVVDSCRDVNNGRKDGFQQAFIDGFHLSLTVEGKTEDHVVCTNIIDEHSQEKQEAVNCNR